VTAAEPEPRPAPATFGPGGIGGPGGPGSAGPYGPGPQGPGDSSGPARPGPWVNGPTGGSGPEQLGGGGGSGRPVRAGRDPRLVAIVIVAIALVVILLRSHHLSATSVMVFCVLIPSIILHEVSHGLAAYACGDDTAKRAGRLTLNPLAHIDVLGTIIVPVIMVLSGVGAFGWAKPVPVNVSKLRHPRNQAVLVSLVGPAVNIVLALLAAFVYRDIVPYADKVGVLYSGDITAQPGWAQVVFFAGYVNVILAVFNLIPLPPLDGSSVVERLIPSRHLAGYYRIRPYTLILPLALVVLSSFGGANGDLLAKIFNPALNWWGHVVGL